MLLLCNNKSQASLYTLLQARVLSTKDATTCHLCKSPSIECKLLFVPNFKCRINSKGCSLHINDLVCLCGSFIEATMHLFLVTLLGVIDNPNQAECVLANATVEFRRMGPSLEMPEI
jgi:hypothetical protein